MIAGALVGVMIDSRGGDRDRSMGAIVVAAASAGAENTYGGAKETIAQRPVRQEYTVLG